MEHMTDFFNAPEVPESIKELVARYYMQDPAALSHMVRLLLEHIQALTGKSLEVPFDVLDRNSPTRFSSEGAVLFGVNTDSKRLIMGFLSGSEQELRAKMNEVSANRVKDNKIPVMTLSTDDTKFHKA